MNANTKIRQDGGWTAIVELPSDRNTAALCSAAGAFAQSAISEQADTLGHLIAEAAATEMDRPHKRRRSGRGCGQR